MIYFYNLLDSGHDNENAFFKVLGDKGPIKSAEEGGDDVEHDKQDKVEICLYRYKKPLAAFLEV